MPETTYREILQAVMEHHDLTRQQSYDTFMQLMDGKFSEVQVAGLLMAMATKGHAVAEITGAAQAMREHAVRIDNGGADVVDIVGTGGTGLKTFNVSTTCTFVAAGAGAVVAKHGSYTNTRPSGAANVLLALGVNIECPPEVVTRCITEAGVGFCFAVKCHPAMKYVVPVRKQLPVRTLFNVLGPLTNPAGAKRQLMGVYDEKWTVPLAEVLGQLGATRVWVIYGHDGMDEISITAPTTISEYRDGRVETRTIQPEDFGLRRGSLDDLAADSPEDSARIIREILDGKTGPARDIVLLNTAAALVVASKAANIAEGITQASQSIDSGAARNALEKLVEISKTG
ncbi:MAG: anthranilate phosphoribosyltransferase [Phycisphaerae bacterium]|nr:anthranilate phosphoribosyltransferase [Phycisphaerae bacterium]